MNMRFALVHPLFFMVSCIQSAIAQKNNEFEAAKWIDSEHTIESIAMLPLRLAPDSATFGLLVLGSPDPTRFTKEMATDFLAKIGDTSSAALSCLIG